MRDFGHAFFILWGKTMDFEKAFSDFIDGEIYDEAHSTLFMLTREAFKAGRKAAQNSTPPKNKILELYNSNSK